MRPDRMADGTMTLDDLVTQLRVRVRRGAAGGRALRLGCAGAPPRPGQASYNVLVVVDTLGHGAAACRRATARAWSEAGHPPPLTLTAREWLSSADVFPMEYADVLDAAPRAARRAAAGGHGRRRRPICASRWSSRCSGKLLQLRQGILAAGGVPKRQLELLRRA